MRNQRMWAAIAAAGLSGVALVAAACTSDEGGTATTTSITATATAAATAVVPAASTTAVTSTPAASATVVASTTAAVKKVNANTASRAEIQAALAAAGVPNAAQWAREVEEYRPYPTDDLTWAKLRKELAKYNPTPSVVDQIIAVLTP